MSAARISELAKDLGLNIGNKLFIVNQVKDEQKDALKRTAEEFNLDLAGTIPEDSKIRDFDLMGRPTIELNEESIAFQAAYSIFDKILDNKTR